MFKFVSFLSFAHPISADARYDTDNYYLSFPRDPIYMKLLVYSSLLLEIAQTLMVTHDTFRIFATGYGDFSGLDDIHLLWLTLPILGGVGLFLFSLCPTRDIRL